MEQINDWIALAEEDPKLDDELRAVIQSDRKELTGSFCRGCGYCMPCPEEIKIFDAPA
jgi:predicted aldo/keto reductase-like oxidoreductase